MIFSPIEDWTRYARAEPGSAAMALNCCREVHRQGLAGAIADAAAVKARPLMGCKCSTVNTPSRSPNSCGPIVSCPRDCHTMKANTWICGKRTQDLLTLCSKFLINLQTVPAQK